MGTLLYKEGGECSLTNEKSHTEKFSNKKELQKQNQVTENTLTDRNRIPNEQNAWKETQPQNK